MDTYRAYPCNQKNWKAVKEIKGMMQTLRNCSG